MPNQHTTPRWPYVRDSGEALYTRYRRGTVVHHIPVMRTNGGDAPPRQVILDQSTKSRRNAAFKFGNAECDWLAMALFTWHHLPEAEAVKKQWKKFLRKWRLTFGEPPCGWLMEIQERGCPHFHVFISAESAVGQRIVALRESGGVEVVDDGGGGRTVVRGYLGLWFQRQWLIATEQLDDADARYFHSLKQVQLMFSPDAAGRYVAKESAKRSQKLLPPEYAGGLGQWWYLNPRWKPRARARGYVSIDNWPFARPYSHVWESELLRAACLGEWDVVDDKKAARFISDWLQAQPGYIGGAQVDASLVAAIREIVALDAFCRDAHDTRTDSEIDEDMAEALERMRQNATRSAQ